MVIRTGDDLVEPNVNIRFGTRRLIGMGRYVDNVHPHVLHYKLPRTWVQVMIWSFLLYVPTIIATILEIICPEWLLPEDIVIKIQKDDPDWAPEGRNEIQNYRNHKALQGLYIPKFYGIGFTLENKPALILSQIDGRSFEDIAHDPTCQFDVADMTLRITEMFLALHRAGITQTEYSPSNLMLVEQNGSRRVMTVDLERVEPLKGNFGPEVYTRWFFVDFNMTRERSKDGYWHPLAMPSQSRASSILFDILIPATGRAPLELSTKEWNELNRRAQSMEYDERVAKHSAAQ